MKAEGSGTTATEKSKLATTPALRSARLLKPCEEPLEPRGGEGSAHTGASRRCLLRYFLHDGR